MANIILKKFASLKAFDTYLKTNETTPNFEAFQHSILETEDFTGTKSIEEANDLMVYGDLNGLEKVKKMGVDDVIKNIYKYKTKAKITSSVVGCAPNVPAYICGTPNSMFNRVQQRQRTKVISLCYVMNASCWYSKEDIFKTAATFLSTVMLLEAKGIRVNVNAGVVTEVGTQTAGFIVNIKKAEEKFNLLRCVYACTNPSFLRRHFFRFMEVTKGISKKFTSTYGHIMSETDTRNFLVNNHIKCDAIFTHNGIFEKRQKPEELIKEILK